MGHSILIPELPWLSEADVCLSVHCLIQLQEKISPTQKKWITIQPPDSLTLYILICVEEKYVRIDLIYFLLLLWIIDMATYMFSGYCKCMERFRASRERVRRVVAIRITKVRICSYYPICSYFDGILPKGPYPPCLRIADRALLAGYPGFVCHQVSVKETYLKCTTNEFTSVALTRNILINP